MNEKKRLKLDQLEIKSFITDLSSQKGNTIKGKGPSENSCNGTCFSHVGTCFTCMNTDCAICNSNDADGCGGVRSDDTHCGETLRGRTCRDNCTMQAHCN